MAMTTVYLYGGTGTYAGTESLEWDSPTVGSAHKFILFLLQDVDAPQDSMARTALAQFGFSDIQLGVGKPIAVEALNDPKIKAFHKHYMGAFAEGCSVVWYP